MTTFSRRLRHLGRAGALASFLLAVAVLVPVTTAGAQPRTVTGTDQNGTYLALGDSVAFGYVPPQATTTTPNYYDAHSFTSYANDVAQALRERVTNASCPGETTASMLTTSAQSNGCENSVTSPVGYRTSFPLHAQYQGSQMAYALSYLADHHHTKLVTIDIGANDAFVCEAETPTCATTPTMLGAVGERITANLVAVFSELRVTAHYTGPIVVLDYYSLTYNTALANLQSEFLNTYINAAATWTTTAFGVTIANGFIAFAAAAPTGSPCDAGLLIPDPTGSVHGSTGNCNIHPTQKGHEALAQAILTALA